MDVPALAEQAYTLFSAVSAQAEELQQRAIQRLVDNISVHHEAWNTERLQLHQQLQKAKGRAQILKGTLQTCQEEQALQRQEHADMIAEASSKLQACQDMLRQAEANAAEERQQHTEELAKTRDQLQVALEYRKKCRSQQAEIKHLQQIIAGLQAKQHDASEQSWRAERQPEHKHNPKDSPSASGSLRTPAQRDPVSLQPTCSRQVMPAEGIESQDAFTQDDQVICSQVAGLLQRLKEAEERVQLEAQKRHTARKNVRVVLQKRDEELKALKAENEDFRRQLTLLGAPQPQPRSGSVAPRTELPQECEATSRPAEACARQGRQQAEQPRALSAAAFTPEPSSRDLAGFSPSHSGVQKSKPALKSVLRAGSGSCSRAAHYEGKQDKGISPGKRAVPDVANVAAVQQRATPAKRPKRDACSMADKQRQSAGAGSGPGDRPAASAPAQHPEQQVHLRAGHVEEAPQLSMRTLQPADVAHLQSAQNIRNSQEAEHGEPGIGSQLTESPQASPSMSPSQLASVAVPVCQAADEHPHSSSVGASPVRAADAPNHLEASSMKPACQAPAQRNAEAAGRKARQLHLVSRPASTAESAEAERQTEPGREKPHNEPQEEAKPAALNSPVRPALPPLPEEGVELAVAPVKEESLRESPAWKVRAAREAAQHAGNSLFADICQPEVPEEDLGDPEGAGLLTQLLGPNRHTAQERHKAGASWKTRQREGFCPGALAFLDLAHVQRNSNSRVCQRLPAIVDRHAPRGPQLPQGAGQAGMQEQGPPDAGPGYKYKEVARKRAEREAMLGVECPDCQRFYEACQTWNSIAPAALPQCGHAVRDAGQKAGAVGPAERVTRDQLRQNASRHRYHYAPPPTPPGFWDIGFMDTQDSRNIGQKDEGI